MEEKLRENAHKESSRRFGPWAAFLRERGNNNWPAHKILLQLAMEHADKSPIKQQADAWLRAGNGQWLRLPAVAPEISLSISLITVYV